MKTNKPGLRQDTGLCSISDFRFFRDAACVTQTVQQQRVTTQPVGLEQERLLPVRQERTVQPERHILEDTALTPELHMSAPSVHKLAHTLQEQNMKEPLVHRQEHKPQRELRNSA